MSTSKRLRSPMAMTEPDHRQSNPLARVGQSDSFAGFTRLSMLIGGAMVTWAAFDLQTALRRIDENQKAIIAVADRTTHVEDTSANVAASLREFRLYTEGQFNALNSDVNMQSQRMTDLDRAQGKTLGRVLCLENKTRCPQ